jgi:hypothetical protein
MKFGSSDPNDDGVSWLKAISRGLSALTQLFAGLQGTVGTVGSFTMPAAASLVVPNVFVKAGSAIRLTATNAAAGTLMGSAKSLYAAPADFVPGVSFTVKTASAAAAAGTETFSYQVINVI